MNDETSITRWNTSDSRNDKTLQHLERSNTTANDKLNAKEEADDTYKHFSEKYMQLSSMTTWLSLPNLYSLVGAYGGPSCLMVTKAFYVVGTSKGPVLIFNTRQYLQAIMIPSLDTEQTSNYLHSPVSQIITSADGTYLTASYISGDVFLWDLNLNNKRFDIATQSDDASCSKFVGAVLQIDNHVQKDINGIGFLGKRHTALVVSDNSGSVKFHSAFRNHLWNLIYNTKEIFKSGPSEKLLCSSIAPTSKYDQSLHMVAILTSDRFLIMSIAPFVKTLYQEPVDRKNLMPSSFVNSSIAWSKSGLHLFYSIGSNMKVIKLSDNVNLDDSITVACDKNTLFQNSESILSSKWIDRRIIGLLTVSHQLIIIDSDKSHVESLKLDLLSQNLLIPPNKHFAIENYKFYILTNSTMKMGSFLSWSEIILSKVQKGDYLNALNTIEFFLTDNLSFGKLLSLRSEQKHRQLQLEKPFINLALAAIRFLCKQKAINFESLYQLFSAVFRTLSMFYDNHFKETFTCSFLEISYESFDDSNINIFYEVVSELVMKKKVCKLPTIICTNILTYQSILKNYGMIECLIRKVDYGTLDINMVVKLCQEHNLTQTIIYIWTTVLQDFISPFVYLLKVIAGKKDQSNIFPKLDITGCDIIFDYLLDSMRLVKKKIGTFYSSSELAKNVKLGLNYILFNGTSINWPPESSEKFETSKNKTEEPAYPYFTLLLSYDSVHLLKYLDNMFEEDSLLDEDKFQEDNTERRMWINRQYVIDMLIDLSKNHRNGDVTAQIAMFVACNAPKYPQFIKLSDNIINELIEKLIYNIKGQEDSEQQQIALKKLFFLNIPDNWQLLAQELKEKKFNKVLFWLYNKKSQYYSLLELYLSCLMNNEDLHEDITVTLKKIMSNTIDVETERKRISYLISMHFELVSKKIGIKKSVSIFDDYDISLHSNIKKSDDLNFKELYLNELFQKNNSLQNDGSLRTLFLEVFFSNEDNKSFKQLKDSIKLKKIEAKDVLEYCTTSKNHEAIALLMEGQHEHEKAVTQIIICIEKWFSSQQKNESILLEYLEFAIDVATQSFQVGNDQCWSQLIICMIRIHGSLSSDSEKRKKCTAAIQTIFLKLATCFNYEKDKKFERFQKIFTAVLEDQNVIMLKASLVKDVFSNIFHSYKLEKSYSKLILKILEDQFDATTSDYTISAFEGCNMNTPLCEICGKIIMGDDLPSAILEAWENSKVTKSGKNFDTYESQQLILFKCHHGFHTSCLKNLGQSSTNYKCLSCLE